MNYNYIKSIDWNSLESQTIDFRRFNVEFRYLTRRLQRISELKGEVRKEVYILSKILSDFFRSERFLNPVEKEKFELHFCYANFVYILFEGSKVTEPFENLKTLCHFIVQYLSKDRKKHSELCNMGFFKTNVSKNKDDNLKTSTRLDLKLLTRKGLFFKTSDDPSENQVACLRIKDFSLGFCFSQMSEINKDIKIQRNKKRNYFAKSIEWRTVGCLISAGDIECLQVGLIKLKALCYDYRYGWVQAQINQLHGENDFVSLTNGFQDKKVQDTISRVEISFPNLFKAVRKEMTNQRILASIIDPNFDIPNDEIHLPTRICLKITSSALFSTNVPKNSGPSLITAEDMYETFAEMNVSKGPLIFRRHRSFQPSLCMIIFLNQLFSNRNETIVECASKIMKIEAHCSFQNFEYLW
jgi:hypothetical protein